MSYNFKCVSNNFEIGDTLLFFIKRPQSEEFSHYVTFNTLSHGSSCTYRRFTESGFLCRHILRLYHANCVVEVPNIYILKRWTRQARDKDDDEALLACDPIDGVVTSCTIWRLQLQKKITKLLCARDSNELRRQTVENMFKVARHEVEKVVGIVFTSLIPMINETLMMLFKIQEERQQRVKDL